MERGVAGCAAGTGVTRMVYRSESISRFVMAGVVPGFSEGAICRKDCGGGESFNEVNDYSRALKLFCGRTKRLGRSLALPAAA